MKPKELFTMLKEVAENKREYTGIQINHSHDQRDLIIRAAFGKVRLNDVIETRLTPQTLNLLKALIHHLVNEEEVVDE